MNIAIVTLPWQLGSRDTGSGRGPQAIIAAGLVSRLAAQGHHVSLAASAELDPAEQAQYGVWNKTGHANAHLAALIAQLRRQRQFVLALESDCSATMGALGGLQQSGVQTIGMVWIDAHADFNTPETTLSGMLGGMPVAISAGLCLRRLRLQSGLAQPIRAEDVAMVGLRDIDPLELDLLREHRVEMVPPDPELVKDAVERLAQRVDAIYVHIDWDVLDPSDIPTASLPVANGPRLDELARVVNVAAHHPKAALLGYASYNADKDPKRVVARNLAANIAASLA
ncbi:MAG: arginase family protein [Chloroflexi bacterium]|nr:arginase family protein [Chloroflexota bacterium]